MEFPQTLYDIASMYAFFSLVTCLTVVTKNTYYLHLIKPFGLTESISYLFTTGVIAFIFAPMFFIMLIFMADVYKEATITALISHIEEDEDE